MSSSDGEKKHLIPRTSSPSKPQQQIHNGTVETPWYLCAPELEAGDSGIVVPGGLSICKAAVFIVAQMAGSGILALSNALAGTGWTGVGLLVTLGLLALYCGTILGKCWNIVREKHEIPKHARDPYPLIGYHSCGKAGKYLVEVCIFLTLVGSSVVYLILSAKQISTVLDVTIGSFSPHTEFRIWILICGAFLIPCTWFASPKEMWLVAYGATLCSLSACCFIIVQSALLIHQHGIAADSKYSPPTVTSFFNSFGTIAFAYGGGVLLPTLQSDMKKPSRFIYAAILGFLGILTLYLPCSILPYLVAGNDIDPNVLVTLEAFPGSDKNMVKIAETLMTFHLLFAIVILSNPTSQLLEEKLGVPHTFGVKRVIIRSLIGILVIGIAELFPNFGPILSFIGASTVTMMSFILPSIFYLRLQENHLVPLHQKIFHIEIVVVALVFGGAGIYASVQGFKNPFAT